MAEPKDRLTFDGNFCDIAKCRIRIYCNNVYIFNNDVLITVFPLPQKYRSTAQKIKRKENNDDR